MNACRTSRCESLCGAWQCTSATSTGDPKSESSVTLVLLDALSPIPVPGLRVRVCTQMDGDCVQTTKEISTLGTGVAEFTFPRAFDGYFKVIDDLVH